MTEPETDVQRLRRLLSAASLEAGIAEEGETAGAAPCRCGGFRTPGDRKCGIAIGGRAKCPGGTVWEWLTNEIHARRSAEARVAALEDVAREMAQSIEGVPVRLSGKMLDAVRAMPSPAEPKPAEPCAACGGSKEVVESVTATHVSGRGHENVIKRKPCPECRGGR